MFGCFLAISPRGAIGEAAVALLDVAFGAAAAAPVVAAMLPSSARASSALTGTRGLPEKRMISRNVVVTANAQMTDVDRESVPYPTDVGLME